MKKLFSKYIYTLYNIYIILILILIYSNEYEIKIVNLLNSFCNQIENSINENF